MVMNRCVELVSSQEDEKTLAVGAGSDLGRLQMEEVGCPLCGGNDTYWNFALVLGQMVTCNQCDLSFVNPRIASAVLNKKLDLWAEQDVVDQERLATSFSPDTQRYYRRFLTWVEPFVSTRQRRLVDVGCSTGGFLSVAADDGWEARGIEVGVASAQYAKETLGLCVKQQSIYTTDLEPSSADLVSMIEVIEHLQDPVLAVKRVNQLLVPGGLLLITTPNFDALYRRLFAERWWVVNCEDEHIVLFNMNSLVKLLESQGFEVLLKRVQGMDVAGIFREWRSRSEGSGVESSPETALDGYYQARTSKQRIKRLLRRSGLLWLVRQSLRLATVLYSSRFSPVYAWGEQLVVVARKRSDDQSVMG